MVELPIAEIPHLFTEVSGTYISDLKNKQIKCIENDKNCRDHPA